jgi:hypothetical protein
MDEGALDRRDGRCSGGPALILQSDRCHTQWRSVFDNRISIVHLRLVPLT